MSLISNATKDTLTTLLAEKAQQPKPLTLTELVIRNKAVLKKMLKNGHSHDDITAVLATESIVLPIEVLEQLLAPASRKKRQRGRPKSRIQSRTHSNTSSPTQSTSTHTEHTSQPDRDDAQESSLQTLTQEQANRISTEWQRLSNERKGLTKQELVASMTTEINAALDAGYGYEDLAALMQQKGIKIAASSLQKYHRFATGEMAQATQQSADGATVPGDAPSPDNAASSATSNGVATASAQLSNTSSSMFMEDFDDEE